MSFSRPRVLTAWLIAAAAAVSGGSGAFLLGTCGPFTDVAADSFCPFVLEIFYLGITTGTTPTTYDPAANVSRLQMAAFLSRTVDGVLKRGSRRAVLDQFWTTQNADVLSLTTLGGEPSMVRSDGADLWVSDDALHRVVRVRGSDGRLLESWTGALNAFNIVIAPGRVYVTGNSFVFHNLYRIDPSQPAGSVTTVATNLGNAPSGIAFDGARIWTANQGGSVCIVTPEASPPYTVTTVTTGFTLPIAALFDGSNVWITDAGASRAIRKLDASGAILQTVTVGTSPQYPIFDGTNIWVPNFASNSVSVVRASSGALLATLTGNGLSLPGVAAFDGQRVLVTDESNNRVSLFKAADLSPLGFVSTGTTPFGACSDGAHFWIAMISSGHLARF